MMQEVFMVVLSLSLSATLIALPLLLGRPLYRGRLSQRWQYYIWLVVLVRLVVWFAVPEINLMQTVFSPAKATEPAPIVTIADETGTAPNPLLMQYMQDTAPPDELLQMEAVEPEQVSSPPQLSTLLGEIWQNLWVVWISVAMMLLIRKITSYRSFERFIRAGWQPVMDAAVLDTYADVCAERGIRKPPPLFLNKLAVSPMLVGIMRPCIVLPDVDMPQSELRMILQHELVHFTRQDILYKWVVQVLVCLHWFNPILYLVRKEISQNCELACDEKVLRNLDLAEHRQYGNTLLATIKTGGSYGDTVASVTMSEEGKMLKERLHAILKFRGRSKLATTVSISLTLILLCGAAFAGAYSSAEPTAPEPSAAVEVVADIPDVTEAPEMPEPTEDTTDGSWSWMSDMNLQGMDIFEEFGNIYGRNQWSSQQYYYRNGYILSLLYVHAQESYDNVYGSVSFTEETLPYASDERFMETARQTASEFFSTHNLNRRDEPIVTITHISGPYNESADDLLLRFYNSRQAGPFTAVLEAASTDAITGLLETAYNDKQDGYLILLMDELPDSYKMDDLTRRAYTDHRTGIFYVLLDRTTPELRKELADRAVADVRMDVVDAVYDTMDSLELDRVVDSALSGVGNAISSVGDAVNGMSAAWLSLIVDEISYDKVLEIAETAIQQNDAASFSIVMDRLDDDDVDRMVSKNFEHLNAAMISLIVDSLSDEAALKLARASFDKQDIAVFSLVMDELEEEDIEMFRKEAYARQDVAFYSMLKDE